MGIIKPGSMFDQKRKFNAKIMADGSLKHKGNEGSIHRVAAKIIEPKVIMAGLTGIAI